MILENVWNVRFMNVQTNVKAISTLMVILLMIIAAITGGIVSYAFTIAYYNKMPQRTALTINDVYINKENVNSFIINVLNPSYSPADAKISRIAISLKDEAQLYDVVETEPSIENGINVPIGESVNITCLKIRRNNANVTLGELIGSFGFAGKTIVVHVFSSYPVAAANMEIEAPYVKLNIAETFDSKFSFKKFNVTLTNDPQSEVNMTIIDVLIPGVDILQVKPDIRGYMIPRGSEPVCFEFNGSWHGVAKTSIIVYTKQGYVFRKEIETKNVYAAIQNVSFDIEHRDHFNITVFNLAESAHYANITKIKCKLDNGTDLPAQICDPSIGVMPNSTVTVKFNWNWTEYRGRNITIVACFLQEFETNPYNAITPPPIIVKVLNENNVFDLRDTKHFDITILNHVSSLEAINITQIKIKETGQILNGTTQVRPQLPYGPITPNSDATFNCTFDWAEFVEKHGRNLTLTINVTTNSLSKYSFDFTFTLPVAELNITAIEPIEISGVKYLNLTFKNLDYSLWNLTLSKIIITVKDLANPLEYALPKNQTVITRGGEIAFLCPFDWQKYLDKDITVTVFTDEAVEASLTYHIP
jgi:archaellum component FlaF (FlaF/FlaG flagellin family)